MSENDLDLPASQVAPAPEPTPEPDFQSEAEPEGETERSVHDRLRAFEDEKLGADAPRHQGQVEKGHGSLFQRLSDEDKAKHAALERLVETEKEVAEARAALAAAEDRLAAAELACGE